MLGLGIPGSPKRSAFSVATGLRIVKTSRRMPPYTVAAPDGASMKEGDMAFPSENHGQPVAQIHDARILTRPG